MVFLNDSTSSLLALRPDGTIRFVSSGNLIDEPGAVVEEAGGGSYLVASQGFVNPGLARVTDAGVQEQVLSGDSPPPVREVALGRANDAVIRPESAPFDLLGVDTSTGATVEIPLLPPLEPLSLFPARDGAPLLLAAAAGSGAVGIYALDDADGSSQLLFPLLGDVSTGHIHPVPEPGPGSAIATALLTIASLAGLAARRKRLGEAR